ncbi:MAG: hypothetical protein HY593_06015 [Candidatus Omnitrophica bacterium]|nr:hypothetical protein [Candidatus Omnitrophota bacterium]
MLGKMKEMMGQFQVLQQLMKDDGFKAFIAHPKMQELFKDPEFKEVAKTRDFAKIMGHPRFTSLMRDPELASLMAKVNVKGFLGK